MRIHELNQRVQDIRREQTFQKVSLHLSNIINE